MWKDLLSLFLRSRCPLCDRTCGGVVCDDCDRGLRGYRFPDPGARWRGDSPLFVWGRYEGKLKRAVSLLKYDSRPDLGLYLGELAGRAWCERGAASGRTFLIPIPLHPERLRRRGYNQAELLARGFGRIAGIPVLPRGLLRGEDTPALYELNLEQRRATMKGAFLPGPDLRGKPADASFLLVDDIYTTGTTAGEAARVLRGAGFRVGGTIALSTGKKWD